MKWEGLGVGWRGYGLEEIAAISGRGVAEAVADCGYSRGRGYQIFTIALGASKCTPKLSEDT